jgi:hypothetical protein
MGLQNAIVIAGEYYAGVAPVNVAVDANGNIGVSDLSNLYNFEIALGY